VLRRPIETTRLIRSWGDYQSRGILRSIPPCTPGFALRLLRGLGHFALVEHIQERRLPLGNVLGRFKACPRVENRIASGIDQARTRDSFFPSEGLWLADTEGQSLLNARNDELT